MPKPSSMRQTKGVSIPQAVRIACNVSKTSPFARSPIGFNTASGTDCMQYGVDCRVGVRLLVSIPQAVRIACNQEATAFYRWGSGFNTASGTDCMQYCLPKPLETVNPKGGFLILPPCLRFSPNRREFFCRKKRLKRGAKPAIPRKLLSTKKT